MTELETLRQQALGELHSWYAAEARSRPERPPSKSALLAAAVVLEHMYEQYPLNRPEFVTTGNQLKGISKNRVERIFRRFNENRPLPSEGGRTTRGTADFAFSLVDRIDRVPKLDSASDADRAEILNALQEQVVRWYQEEYLDRERITFDASLEKSFESMVGEILANAARSAGAVAQHLVGAKLQLRYPEIIVENHSYTAGDQQTGRPGDFLVGSTVFHVTMSPNESLVAKCRRNIRDGYRVYLLVPSGRIALAKGLVENAGLQGRVSVESSIESFVGQNLDEIGGFSQEAVPGTLAQLLHLYNHRVHDVELDQSLQIEIPELLRHL